MKKTICIVQKHCCKVKNLLLQTHFHFIQNNALLFEKVCIVCYQKTGSKRSLVWLARPFLSAEGGKGELGWNDLAYIVISSQFVLTRFTSVCADDFTG